MAKDKKISENKKKADGAKKSSKSKNNSQSINAGCCHLTWIAAGYQFVSIVRIVRKISDRAHPASYLKSAKDNLIMPIVKRNCPEFTQDIVGAATEVIEFIISPTRYILNIVSYTVADTTGELIKNNYSITHPELRAGVDVVFSEAAYQVVDKITRSSDTKSNLLQFFKSNSKRDSSQPIASPFQFRGKL